MLDAAHVRFCHVFIHTARSSFTRRHNLIHFFSRELETFTKAMPELIKNSDKLLEALREALLYAY